MFGYTWNGMGKLVVFFSVKYETFIKSVSNMIKG